MRKVRKAPKPGKIPLAAIKKAVAMVKLDMIEDGFGSLWPIKCAECGKDTMVVTRPGKAQCMECG